MFVFTACGVAWAEPQPATRPGPSHSPPNPRAIACHAARAERQPATARAEPQPAKPATPPGPSDSLPRGQSRAIACRAARAERCNTGETAWFGGRNLADLVCREPGAGSVVELGCGLGLAGIVAAAALGAGGFVLLTDGDARVAARAGENARANAGPGVAASFSRAS